MKNIKLILLGLMIISIFSFSTFSIAQETANYKAKAGDSQSYKINKYIIEGKSEYQSTYDWQDGTSSNVTIKAGLTFTVTVCNITGNGTNAQAYIKTIISGKTTTCQVGSFYLSKVYDNTTYYQNLVNSNSTKYQLKDNVFTTITDSQFSGIIYHDEISFNIETGWLIKLVLKNTFSNGTISSNLELNSSNVTNNSQTSASSTISTIGLSGFNLSSLWISFSILLLIAVLRRCRKL